MDFDRIPEAAFLSGPSTYLWPRDVGVRLADIPADGVIIPWPEFERHKLVYYGLLNASPNGVTAIDGERVYENVRLCQVDQTGTDHCAPK